MPEFPYKRADGVLLRYGSGLEVRAHRRGDGSVIVVWWLGEVVRDCVTFRADEAQAIGRLAGMVASEKAA